MLAQIVDAEWRTSRPVLSRGFLALCFGCLCTNAATAQTTATEKLDRIESNSNGKETHLPEFRFGDDQLQITISGHINKGVLAYDDGMQTLDYWLVDNANSSTRARLQIYTAFGDDFAAGATLEGQWTPYSTGSINQTNRGNYGGSNASLRKAEVWIGDNADADRFGKIWIGQGSMASDGATEIDLSGTEVVGYSGVGDLAGGQLFRSAGTNILSTVMIDDAFSNLDGLSRLLRVRYDSPQIAGFSLSGSYGTKVVPTASGKPGWDAALRYTQNKNNTLFQAGLAFADSGNGKRLVAGSASLLLPSDINFTVAGGRSKSGGVTSRFIYGKVGYKARLNDAGVTALSVDYFHGQNFNSNGSRSRSYGLQIVQNFDYWKTELYLGLRRYEFSELANAYSDSVGIMSGARMKF